jgi:magnesium-transporting ATPase (P-type)
LFRKSIKSGSPEEKEQLHEYAQCLAVCHSVQVDKDQETGNKTYQASSPDELALVDGAKL